MRHKWDNKGVGKNFAVGDGLKPVTAGGNSTGFEAGIRHVLGQSMPFAA